MKKLLIVTAVIALIACSAPRASADTFLLNIDNCTGTCGLPAGSSYGTVTLTQVGLNVLVNVALETGIDFANGGFAGQFGFNGPSGATLSGFSTGFAAGPAATDAEHFDGFGNFDYSVLCTACGNGASSPFHGPLAFTVQDRVISDFLQASVGGSVSAFFVADVAGVAPVTGGVRPTGAVGAIGTPTVPEPASLLLLGGGLASLGVAIRRRRRS